jgi:hypothetical protein
MLKEGAWANQACYIVGGGPSLKTFDWNLLKSRRNILVINMAFLSVPWADIFFTEDLRVLEELIAQKADLKKAFSEFRGTKVFHCLDESYKAKALAVDVDLHIIERKCRTKIWSRSFEEGLSLSSNSFIGALNICTILDANPIHLLGIDCRRTKADANYHNLYPELWKMPEGQDKEYASDATHWAALHTRNRTVVNLINPDFESALECWPKKRWEEVL